LIFAPVGSAVLWVTATEIESLVVKVNSETEMTAAVELSLFKVVAVPFVVVTVRFVTPADEGPEAITPNPNAATTASAMRLKVVLLDICFLSIVVTKTFSVAALR